MKNIIFNQLLESGKRILQGNNSDLQKELAVTFLLEENGQTHEVFASHVEGIYLDLHPYGYEATVCFYTYDQDDFDPLFSSDKVINATLTFKSEDLATNLLEFKGIVTHRFYQGIGIGKQKEHIRRYEVCFKDSAQVTWSSHFPVNIYINQTMKDVIDTEKNPAVSLSYDWDTLNTSHPILAFSLQYREDLPEDQQVSFYSFLTWYLHQQNGILNYDYKEDSYSIVGKKTEEGSPIDVADWWVSPAICIYPTPPRYNERTIKHSPIDIDNQDREDRQAFTSVRKDAFDPTGYRPFPEQNSLSTLSSLSHQKPEIRFKVQKLSETFNLEHLLPGTLITFKKNQQLDASWSEDPAFKDHTYRLKTISIQAQKMPPGAQAVCKPVELYQLDIQLEAESKDETHIPRPCFNPPLYPFSILGKVFCEIGDKEQTTFNLNKDEKISIDQYQVVVPLAGKDKKLVVPFNPDFTPGHSYFPLCKDQQVLLSIYFQTAKIERIIDWQPLSRLPLGTQGNQTVFASNGKDQYMLQRHEYKDGKDSVFIIQQLSSSDQSQTIQIKEKEITIAVQEKGKNTVNIHLNRDSGLQLTLKDESSGVTQQSSYNTTGITHLSEGSEGKSTIVQKPDSISIECQKYLVSCDEISIKAKKTFNMNATNKACIEAPVVHIKDTVKLG